MTVLFCSNTGKKITLTNQIASSGEGTVWNTDWSGYLAKVYHSPHHERVKKLEVMVTHPPREPNSHHNHFSFAWPKSLLRDSNGWVLGFLMPAITGGVELIDVYNPQRRQRLSPKIDWYFLHTTAMNIASIIQALHFEGYVLGDIKSQNILVNDCALPSIIDTDSFQVRHPNTGEIYRCLVGSEGFTPVELLAKDFHTTEQSEVHDRFRLAVIIYHLLFGNHPFQGQWTGKEDSPDTNELIRQGFWPYAPNSLIKPGLLTIPLDIVHSEIQQCFKRCFNDGHTRPDLRPTAGEWFKALKVAIKDLTPCSQITNHYHSKTYGNCYWCERASKLGVDIFPGVTIQQPKSSATSSTSQSKVFAADNISELVKHKGQEITVEGKIVSINDHAQDNKFILNFGKLASSGEFLGYFRIIICSSSLQSIVKLLNFKINCLKDLVGKDIRINGTIQVYKNKDRYYPQIVIEDPELIVNRNKVNTNQSSIQIKYIEVINQSSSQAKPDQSSNQQFFLAKNQASVYCKDGRTCARQKNYQEALQYYSEALLLKPDYYLAYYYRGRAYEKTGDYQSAIKDYNEFLHINSKYPSAYYERGLIREKLGDKQGAINDFQAARQLGHQLASKKLKKLNQ